MSNHVTSGIAVCRDPLDGDLAWLEDTEGCVYVKQVPDCVPNNVLQAIFLRSLTWREQSSDDNGYTFLY